MRGHNQAVTNLQKANQHVRECNEGRQKLVDAESKAKTSLAKEKEKTKKLTKDVASLKKALKAKTKGGKKGSSKGDDEEDEGQVAQMEEELEKANKEIARLSKKLTENEGELASKQENLQAVVKQMSELKSSQLLESIDIGKDLPTQNEETKALEEQVSTLKKENVKLKKELKELEEKLKEARKTTGAKDPYAHMRNEDVNKSLKEYVQGTLCRSVIFARTKKEEKAAITWVWESCKGSLKLEEYHDLDLDKFILYYGPLILKFIGNKRSDLQAAMKRAARGKLHFWASCCDFSLNAACLLLTSRRLVLYCHHGP